LSRLAPQWAQTDPQAAITFAQDTAAGSGQNNFLSSVAGALANSDPKAALVWRAACPTAKGATRSSPVSLPAWCRAHRRMPPILSPPSGR